MSVQSIVRKPLCTSTRWSLLRFNGGFRTMVAKAHVATGESVLGEEEFKQLTVNTHRLAPMPIDLYIDTPIRRYLSIRNNERKQRVHLSKEICIESVSLDSIRDIIEKKLAILKDQPYALTYRIASNSIDYNPMATPKPLLNDGQLKDVLTQVFPQLQSVQAFKEEEATKATMKKNAGALQIHIEEVPGVFPPLDFMSTQQGNNNLVPFLKDMPNPLEATRMSFLSFYTFHDDIGQSPAEIAVLLRELWRPFRAVGRVYVAPEGINGQMAIPSNVLENFYAANRAQPIFGPDFYFNVDHEITREQFEENKPFKNLHIRERAQILADGLMEPLDWKKSGQAITASEWHEQLDDPDTVVLDCRNSYESDVGTFDNAIPLNTTFFRESWDSLHEALEKVPKDTPIMTFCTGGIRCVKINAYLDQVMGYSNVSRLKGGIIAYAREVGGHLEGPERADASLESIDTSKSKFKGVNYVFDERMGARVTDDVFSVCETCGAACNSFTNCNGDDCHVRFIQCIKCASSYHGCCSKSCQQDHNYQLQMQRSNGLGQSAPNQNKSTKSVQQMQSRSYSASTRVLDNVYTDVTAAVGRPTAEKEGKGEDGEAIRLVESYVDEITSYCEDHSVDEPSLLQECRIETAEVYANQPGAARMISGALQGHILSLVTTLTKARNVLELGTFTGYSALAFAQGSDIKEVYTCDIDPQAAALAQKYFTRFNEEAGRSVINFELRSAEDMLTEMRLREKKFDIVFIDADKKKYRDYLLELLGEGETSNDCMLEPGAILVLDNTLWKGLVLHSSDKEREGGSTQWLMPEHFGKRDRMLTLAQKMHDFNQFVKEHSALSPVLLPIRDGLTLVRYCGRGQK